MTHEEKKVAKIVEELTLYFFAIGADCIESSIEKGKNEAIITFQANYDPEYKEDLDSLDEYFNGQKNAGIEDVYWELAGSGEPGESSQLLLLGMMIDEAEVILEDDFVKLLLHKKLLD